MIDTVARLLWAFPVALLLHVFEEFAFPGGFIRWIGRYNARRLKAPVYYVGVNAAALAGTIAIALFAKSPVGYWIYLYSTGLMAGNALSHLRAGYQQRKYCPGSFTGVFVLIPLFCYASWFFLSHAVIGIVPGLAAIAIGPFIGFSLFAVDNRSERPAGKTPGVESA